MLGLVNSRRLQEVRPAKDLALALSETPSDGMEKDDLRSLQGCHHSPFIPRYNHPRGDTGALCGGTEPADGAKEGDHRCRPFQHRSPRHNHPIGDTGDLSGLQSQKAELNKEITVVAHASTEALGTTIRTEIQEIYQGVQSQQAELKKEITVLDGQVAVLNWEFTGGTTVVLPPVQRERQPPPREQRDNKGSSPPDTEVATRADGSIATSVK